MYKYGKVCAKLGHDNAEAFGCMETACKFPQIFPNATFWAGVLTNDLLKRTYYWRKWLNTQKGFSSKVAIVADLKGKLGEGFDKLAIAG